MNDRLIINWIIKEHCHGHYVRIKLNKSQMTYNIVLGDCISIDLEYPKTLQRHLKLTQLLDGKDKLYS